MYTYTYTQNTRGCTSHREKEDTNYMKMPKLKYTLVKTNNVRVANYEIPKCVKLKKGSKTLFNHLFSNCGRYQQYIYI